ncbi:hypothetical protein N8I77_008283 [Diaporthe amygdali]|uniref:Uncharacterized protein n=1 Tax=Phomopsis amygdali TaxID=1214568 RepID=A0AAD9SEN5_PHOAM|nr:hypothetical protein N8I77_008283 [Diaporthe amygdali]
MQPPFYQLSGGQPQSTSIPVPPQHHQPALGGRLPPAPPPAALVHQQRPASMVGPMPLHPQMQRPMPPPAAASFPPHPPHPPRHLIPSHFQRPVVVSDLREESVTEDDIREDLSDYIILRFEKIEPYDEYDSEGEEVKASWDNCIRTRIADVDKAEARKEIRRLNKEDAKRGKTLLEKQNALGTKQQDQLAKAQRELSLEEHDARFHTKLAQIDYTLKPVVNKHEKIYTRGPNTKKKIHQKKSYERTSITAYFRRCPKPEQVPSELARCIEMEKQREADMMRMRHPQMQQQMVMHHGPQAVQPHQPGPMLHPQAGPMCGPGPMPGQVLHAGGMPMHQSHPGKGPGRPHTPIQVEVEHRKDKHHKSGHSRSSGSSEYSDFSSSSGFGSESTLVTEPSRSSASYKGKKHYDHKRKSLRYLEEPRNFGVEVHRPRRRHSLLEEPSYIVTGSGARVPIIHVPTPPRKAAIPIENLDQIRADAYRAGRSDEKVAFRHTLDDADKLDLAARRYQPRYAPRPEIINGVVSPTRIRHVTASEVGRQLDDDFRRLRLGPDSHYHDDFGDFIHLDAQRIREERAREEQESIMRAQIDEDALYRRRREDSPPPSINPFTPLSRRTGHVYDIDHDFRR